MQNTTEVLGRGWFFPAGNQGAVFEQSVFSENQGLGFFLLLFS